MRAASANVWTGVQILSVIFVAVLTAAAAQLSFPLPFTPVPFTIQPMVVLIGAAALGSRLGALSQILYLTLGIAGLPVFAYAPELPQGLGATARPVGRLPDGVSDRGICHRQARRTRLRSPLFDLDPRDGRGPLDHLRGRRVVDRAASRVCETALATGLYPFIVVDVIKIIAAGLVLPTAWKFLRH